jgi:hypothetical protein
MIVIRPGVVVNDLSTNCDYNFGNTLPDVDADRLQGQKQAENADLTQGFGFALACTASR